MADALGVEEAAEIVDRLARIAGRVRRSRLHEAAEEFDEGALVLLDPAEQLSARRLVPIVALGLMVSAATSDVYAAAEPPKVGRPRPVPMPFAFVV